MEIYRPKKAFMRIRYRKIRKNPKTFHRLFGVTPQEFEVILKKVGSRWHEPVLTIGARESATPSKLKDASFMSQNHTHDPPMILEFSRAKHVHPKRVGLKIFKILADRYRGKRKHYSVKFNTIAGIVNLKNDFSAA